MCIARLSRSNFASGGHGHRIGLMCYALLFRRVDGV